MARRAERILAATRDLVDFARHRDVLSGRLLLGIIPTLAPYILPRLLPRLQAQYPRLRLEVRETQTKVLLAELAGGELDTALLALPSDAKDIETLRLFDDRFLLAVPAADRLPARGRVGIADVDQRRLILLEEGHCLRDQALAFCATKQRDAPAGLGSPAGLGATSLATVMQMVANGYGVTLLPEVAVDAEARDARVKCYVLPSRSPAADSAGRRTSPRKGLRGAGGDCHAGAWRVARARGQIKGRWPRGRPCFPLQRGLSAAPAAWLSPLSAFCLASRSSPVA